MGQQTSSALAYSGPSSALCRRPTVDLQVGRARPDEGPKVDEKPRPTVVRRRSDSSGEAAEATADCCWRSITIHDVRSAMSHGVHCTDGGTWKTALAARHRPERQPLFSSFPASISCVNFGRVETHHISPVQLRPGGGEGGPARHFAPPDSSASPACNISALVNQAGGPAHSRSRSPRKPGTASVTPSLKNDAPAPARPHDRTTARPHDRTTARHSMGTACWVMSFPKPWSSYIHSLPLHLQASRISPPSFPLEHDNRLDSQGTATLTLDSRVSRVP